MGVIVTTNLGAEVTHETGRFVKIVDGHLHVLQQDINRAEAVVAIYGPGSFTSGRVVAAPNAG